MQVTLKTKISGSGSISWEYDEDYGYESRNTLYVPSGTKVISRAVPKYGWQFDHWEGSLSGAENPNEFVATADLEIVAVFTQTMQIWQFGNEQNNCLALSPDGNFLVMGDRWGKVRLRDTSTGKDMWVFSEDTSPVTHVAFSPYGKTILAINTNNILRLWHGTAASPVKMIGLEGDAVKQVVFAPEAPQLLTIHEEGTARLWQLVSGNLLHLFICPESTPSGTIQPAQSRIFSAVFSSDGTQVVTGCTDATIRAWDVRTGAYLSVLVTLEGAEAGLVISPTGSHAITIKEDGTTTLWDLKNGGSLCSLLPRRFIGGRSGTVHAAFSNDGKQWLVFSSDDSADLYDVEKDSYLWSFYAGFTEFLRYGAWSLDGKTILLQGNDRTWLLDANYGTEIPSCYCCAHRIKSTAFSPDGTKILTGSDDGAVRLWDALSGQSLVVYRGHQCEVISVSFSPDGKKVLSISQEGEARLWDMESGVLLLTFTGQKGKTASFQFLPDGKKMIFIEEEEEWDWQIEDHALWIADLETGNGHTLRASCKTLRHIPPIPPTKCMLPQRCAKIKMFLLFHSS